MRFRLFGPYAIEDRGESRYKDWLDKDDFDHLWDEVVDKQSPGLSQACGVYLFGLRGVEGKRKGAGKTLPWYVGKAEKQTFRQECFTPRHQNEYNRIRHVEYRGHGTPFVYLFARTERDGRFSRPTQEEYAGVRFVEDLLIQLSLTVNVNLINTQLTKQAQQSQIPGLLNHTGGRVPDSARSLRGLFGVTAPLKVKTKKTGQPGPRHAYRIFGPYSVPVRNKRPKVIDPEDVAEMWTMVKGADDAFSLEGACGVYVLAIRHGESVKPWYIGTASNSTLGEECLTKDIDNINSVVGKRGTPVIYFLAQVTATGRCAKASATNSKNIMYVKDTLLRYGVLLQGSGQKNQEILTEDERDTRMLRDLEVEGLINRSRGQPRAEVKQLRTLLGLRTAS